MDIAFRGLINQFIVVYLDDVTVFSKNKTDHLAHLRAVLQRCHKYDISLNPKKSIFVVEQGKILGFIVSSEGMIIDYSCGVMLWSEECCSAEIPKF
jgi:hypothetical protein